MGEKLSTAGELEEANDVDTSPRLDPAVPLSSHGTHRTKVAVGPFGQDFGDVTQDAPFPAESRAQRQLLELARVAQGAAQLNTLRTRSSERIEFADSRGQDISMRGVR